MAVERQARFWLSAAALLAFVLWLLGNVLLPFVAGLALAYLLDPLASRLERAGVRRLLASLFIIGVCGVVIVAALTALAPILAHQSTQFIERLPSIVARLQEIVARYGADVGGYVRPAFERFGLSVPPAGGEHAAPGASELVGQGANWAATVLSSLWKGGQALVGILALLVITPVVTFYLLVDWPRLLGALDSLVPLPHRDVVRGLAREIDAAMAGFIRGQSFVCGFLGLWYGLGFTWAGLNFGLLIGMTAGLLSFVPYVGSLTGLFLSVSVALVQGPGWELLAMVLAVQIIGQFIEGNVLTPRYVGDAVGLHPVWVMLALVAFGSLFGLTGLILAVPIAAAIGVLTRFAVREYKASPLHTGAAPRGPKDPDAFP